MESIVEPLITPLVSAILNGGPEIVATLVLFVLLLLWERRRILRELSKRDQRIMDLVDDYQAAMASTVAAMASLKELIYQLRW